jgi:pimeloyl-ACP methyl ester carboxylesterase
MPVRSRTMISYADISIDVLIDQPDQPVMDHLVLLPSSSRDSEDFDDLAERFAVNRFQVLRPQPRGMCGSVGPMDGLTLHDYARDVAAVIRQMNAAPAFVFGHAFGQWVGRCVAADHPMLVKGVILAAAAAKSADPSLRAELAKCVDTSLPDDVRLRALQIAFFAPGHDPSGWLSNWHPLAAKAQRAASAATAQADWWTAGSAPVLDLQAEHDPWRPAETRSGIRDDLGAHRVTTAMISDASHALIPEQPLAVVKAVSDWTRKIAAGGLHG